MLFTRKMQSTEVFLTATNEWEEKKMNCNQLNVGLRGLLVIAVQIILPN